MADAPAAPRSARRALARRTLADSRTRTTWFGVLFFASSAAQVITYASSYPTLRERLELARTFGDNRGLRLLYGVPHDLLHTGGWAAWRLGALPIFAALWGVLAAVRAMRAEEDAGRAELVLAGPVARGAVFRAGLIGIAAGAAIVWLALFAGIAIGDVGPGAAAYLALSLLSPLPVFVGVGAVASQLAPAKRIATALGGLVLGVALLLRMVADTAPDLGGLRWATPLGWAEELRPSADPRPLVLALPVVATVALLVVAARLAERRDVGTGLLRSHDTGPARLGLLSSPITLALRTMRGGLIAWTAAVGVFAVILGAISDSVASGLSDSLREEFQKFGTDAASAAGFLGLEFLFFVLALSLFACFELGALREEEAEGRLETLLVLPVSRTRWLAGRLALVAACAAALALVAGLLSWAGAVSQGADVSFGVMLEAAANCLPAVLLFLGLGALAFAAAPRLGVVIAYVLVGVAFLWEAVGGLVDAPRWVLGISPFHHVQPVPAVSLDVPSAIVMLAVGVAAGLAALRVFARRDLVGV